MGNLSRKSRSISLTKEQRSARSERLRRRLLGYSATAGAALAVAGTPNLADATIISNYGFTGPYYVNWTNNNQLVDLDGNGAPFQFHLFSNRVAFPDTWYESHRLQLNKTTQYRNGFWYTSAVRHGQWIRAASTYTNGARVKRLSAEAQIGPGDPLWGTGAGQLERQWGDPLGSGAYEFNGQRGYIGVRFDAPTGTSVLYGWIDLGISADGATGTIYGWAYEDSGGSIEAGAVPEPGTLTALACGVATAAGVAFLKRRK
jgi:hypothetical protein